jgi:RHS repeat-associated protein
VDGANQLSTATHFGLLTVSGNTPTPASSVVVSGFSASRYTDNTFAAQGFTPANGNNTYTVTAQDTVGRLATNIVTVNLPTTVTYTYDANGNLLSDGQRTFDYDDENQLTNVTVTGAWKTDWVYDGLGRRRIRREFTWTGGAWVQTNETRYVMDGALVLQERHWNSEPGTNNPERILTYTRGLDLSGTMRGAGGIGGLLARTDASGSAFYHADGSGNITALIDAQNKIAARYLYDPYGNLLAKFGPLADANVYRFSSKEFHAPSGITLYEGRGYDANLQRWPNRDPLGEPGFEVLRRAAETRRTLDPNLYAFLKNDPLNTVDPFGLIGLPTDIDSISQSIWQAIRQGLWDEALDLIDQEADLLGDNAEKLRRALKQMRGLDKWRKQMCNWSRKQVQQQLKTLKKTLEDHLKEPYRNGKDDPETLRIRYMIDYLEKLLK